MYVSLFTIDGSVAPLHRPATCTTPKHQDSSDLSSNFCLDPPSVSVDELYSDPSGPLDSWNTYVAEQLLKDSVPTLTSSGFRSVG